jgi:glutaredoxin
MLATVWTQPNCPYCDEVKKALTDAGYSIVEKNITECSDFMREQFKKQYRTTPQVFVGHKHIGDCSTTVALLKEGPLK